MEALWARVSPSESLQAPMGQSAWSRSRMRALGIQITQFPSGFLHWNLRSLQSTSSTALAAGPAEGYCWAEEARGFGMGGLGPWETQAGLKFPPEGGAAFVGRGYSFGLGTSVLSGLNGKSHPNSESLHEPWPCALGVTSRTFPSAPLLQSCVLPLCHLHRKHPVVYWAR